MTDDVTYYPVARHDEIPEGEGRAYAVGGRMVAVFKDGSEFFAIDDLCPHMGASLAPGYLEDGVVVCPWHAWRFRICDGTWCDNPKVKIDRFPVRVQDGVVQVGVAPSTDESCDADGPATNDEGETA